MAKTCEVTVDVHTRVTYLLDARDRRQAWSRARGYASTDVGQGELIGVKHVETVVSDEGALTLEFSWDEP